MTDHPNSVPSVTFGSGDVFADLDLQLSPDDRIKVQMAAQISHTIAQRDLTQSEAAKIIGIDQAKISNLTRGRIAGFSIERLMKFVTALGWDIDIEMKPSKEPKGSVRFHSVDDSKADEKILA